MSKKINILGLSLIILIGGVIIYQLQAGTTAPNTVKTRAVNEFRIAYSDDTKTAVVRIPYDYETTEELKSTANIISELYNSGYVYVGMYQTDTGIGSPHFVDILIFRSMEQ